MPTEIRQKILQTALTLTEDVEKAADSLVNANAVYEDSVAAIKTFEGMLMQEITVEINAEGKAKFSNELARNAELAVRKSKSENLTKLQESMRKTALERHKLQNEIEKNRSQVSLYKAFLHGSE